MNLKEISITEIEKNGGRRIRSKIGLLVLEFIKSPAQAVELEGWQEERSTLGSLKTYLYWLIRNHGANVRVVTRKDHVYLIKKNKEEV